MKSLAHRYIPAWLVSGVLCGASYLFIRDSLFPVLIWFSLVPLLLRLENVAGFRQFYGQGLAMLWVVELFTLGRVFDISPLASLLVVSVQAVVVSGVFILFWLLRASLGWRMALLTLPACWTAWEWLYAMQPLQIPTFLGATQADFYPLIQFYDLTGVWGGTFLIVLCNVLLTLAISRNAQPVARFKAATVVLAAIFTPALAYSAWIFYGPGNQDSASSVRVALVQSGAPQKDKALVLQAAETSGKIAGERPDLVVWPETSLERDAGKAQNLALWKSLYSWVAGNDIAVFTGIIDVEQSANSMPDGQGFYNAATLVTPQLAYYALRQHDEHALDVKVYRKRKPFPFAERVPFLDAFPQLYWLAMHEPGKQPRNYGYGAAPQSFAFLDRQGIKRQVGGFICFEALFPSVVADLARHGAGLLVTVSNDHDLNSNARWVTAAHIPIRAIETRRSIVRSGTVGYTMYADSFGRVDHVLPMDTPGAAIRQVKLAQGESLYVRWGDWFPAMCLLVISLFAIGSAFRRRAGRFSGER